MNLNGKQGVMYDHALTYSTWAHNRSTSHWCGGKSLKKNQKLFSQSVECQGKRIQLRSLCDAINLHSCFKWPRSWYSNMHIYAGNEDIYEIKTIVPSVAPHRCWLIAVEIYSYVVEISMETYTLSWRSWWWPNGNSSKTWNFETVSMSPYLIVVLISCISVAIDKLQCNQGIPRCNISKVVCIMTFHRVHIMCLGISTDA
jgi:hypothetical protein